MDHLSLLPGIFMDELHVIPVCGQQFQENNQVDDCRRSIPSCSDAVSWIYRVYCRKSSRHHNHCANTYLYSKEYVDVYTLPQGMGQVQQGSE